MMYFRTDTVIAKEGISLIPNAIKYAPHSAHGVDLKGHSGEDISMFDIGITFGVVANLNATPENSKAA